MISLAQAFTISLMSNGASGQKGTAASLAAGLQSHIDAIFADTNFIAAAGNWSRVWGPYVYQVATSDVADNALFLAYNATDNTYVLSIAATNSASKVDWVDEDAAAGSLVLLPNGDGKSHISWGTNVGLAFISGLGGANNTIVDILASDLPNKSTASLVIAGHSLAGALSPALGTSLFNAVNGPLAQAGWTASNLYVLPTAGPSVGDQNYYNLFTATFPDQAGGFNQLHYNVIDIVPQAWDPKLFNASALLNLYQPNLAASQTITNLVNTAMTVPPSPNPYIQLPATSFNGGFQKVHGVPPFTDPTAAYIAQMLYQHIYAYVVALAPNLATLKDTNGNLIFTLINPFTQLKARAEVTALALDLEAKYGQ